MEKRVKLGKNKLTALEDIQKQKKELNDKFSTLTNSEQLILSFILEDNEIDPTNVEALKIEDNELVFTLKIIEETTPFTIVK